MLRFTIRNPLRSPFSISKRFESSNLPQISKKQIKPNAALPAMPLSAYTPRKPTEPYVPKLQHERTSFEYTGLPKPEPPSNTQRPWKRHMALFVGSAIVVYCAYAYAYLSDDEETNPQKLLSPDNFTKFVVTNKIHIDEDHFLLEISPKFGDWKEKLSGKQSFWDGSKIWSVEVKQPEIMVTRRYTPLPIQIFKSLDGEPMIKLIDEEMDLGKMTFYIKKYKQGEVARWLSGKTFGDEVEIRGPYTEFQIPFHPLDKVHKRPQLKDLPSKMIPDLPPTKSANYGSETLPAYDNLNFYAAGTGVAPALQVLLSKNPYKGFMNLHYSCQTEGEIPFKRFLYFLEKLDRVKVNYYINEQGKFISGKEITKPVEANYKGFSKSGKEQYEKEMLLKAKMEEIIREKEQSVVANNLQLEKTIPRQKPQSETPRSEESIETTEKTGARFSSALQQAMYTRTQPKSDAALSIVCGPDGYVEYLAGRKTISEQGEIKGLLGDKKWDNSNVYKL